MESGDGGGMNINRVPKVANCGAEDPSKLKYYEACFLPLLVYVHVQRPAYFSCEEAALEVLMYVCPSVPKLKF